MSNYGLKETYNVTLRAISNETVLQSRPCKTFTIRLSTFSLLRSIVLNCLRLICKKALSRLLLVLRKCNLTHVSSPRKPGN